MSESEDSTVNDNKGLRTRTEIMNAAAALFVQQGVSGTTLRQIAEAAGVKRPAFYYHFGSKEEVLRALVTESTEQAARELLVANEKSGSPTERLERCVKTFVEWILLHPVRFIVADRNELSLPPALAQRHAAGKRRVLKIFEGLLTEGISKGVFRPVDARVVALSIIGMCTWTAWWFKDTGRLSKTTVAASIADAAVAAVSRGPHANESGGLNSAISAIRRELDYLESSAKRNI